MRNIVSQITALWDVCRRERKHTATGTSDTHSESNLAVIHGRTWRPWVCIQCAFRRTKKSFSLVVQEHIYALSKVSRQPFIPPYNPAGKYVVRLFFLVRTRSSTDLCIMLRLHRALGERLLSTIQCRSMPSTVVYCRKRPYRMNSGPFFCRRHY